MEVKRWKLNVERRSHRTAYEGRQATLDVWTLEFKEERPHEALGMKMPAEIYVKSSRPWKGTPETLDYEGMGKRRVNKNGIIHHEGCSYFLSTALAGWDVGLQASAKGRVDVYFGLLLLGQIEPESASFAGIKTAPGKLAPGEPEPPPRATGVAAGGTPGSPPTPDTPAIDAHILTLKH